MIADEIKMTYIGGPTALFEVAGLRFLTDPTFDPKDSEYRTNVYTLHKLKAPAIRRNQRNFCKSGDCRQAALARW
jgi:L-ascorbate metabolism protein UlaG (beta-lactamase superfamily)